MSGESWEEKSIHRGDVISAWLVVLIELVVALAILGMSTVNCCVPNHAKAIRTATSGWSHVVVSQESAPHASYAADGLTVNMLGPVSQRVEARRQPRDRRRLPMLSRKVLEQPA